MALKCWLGNAGSGKSHQVYEEVIREAGMHKDRTYLVIVPEQFTLQTQHDLVNLHPDGGILNIDVLSFARLSYRVFEEVGFAKAPGLLIDDMGKNLIFTIIIIPMMITPVAVGLIWRLILHPQLGIFNDLLSFFNVQKIAWLGDPRLALPTVMFVDIWQNIPYMVLVLMAGLVTLPKEPYEAASIDGASRLQSFFRLTVPMMMPTFSVVILLRAIMSFKTYDLIYVMTRGGPGTVTQVISYTIYNQAYRYLNTGTAASMSIYLVLMIVPIAILFLRLSRSREE